MNFLECDLEDLIFEYSLTKEGRNILANRGLFIDRPLMRQVRLSTYGVADLIEIVGAHVIQINIIELKKGELSSKDYTQLCRYMTAIKRLVSIQGIDITVSGTLIGKSIKQEGDFCFLINEGRISVYTYEFDLEKGLVFNRSNGWHRPDEGEEGSLNKLIHGAYCDNYPEEVLEVMKISEQLNKENNE